MIKSGLLHCCTSQLSELLSIEFYGEWIGLVAEFTTKSLLSWQVCFPFFFLTHSLSTGLFNNQFPIVLTIEYLQWASNSVYYLLSLWSRLVTSVPYLKGDTPSMLDETVPKITEGFITSRINSVQVLISNEMMELLSISVEAVTFVISCCFYPSQASFANDSSDDTLDNVDVLQEQLESLPYLCRFQVAISCQVLVSNLRDNFLLNF